MEDEYMMFLDKLMEYLMVAAIQAAGKAAWNWLKKWFDKRPRL